MSEEQTIIDSQNYHGMIVEYSPVDAALAELRARYAGVVFPVETKDGMRDAKEVRYKLVKLRTGLEAKRKEIKEPALRRAQAIDAEAKAITAAIRAIEDPIDDQIKAEEARIEAERAAKAAKRAEIQGKIDSIRRLPLELACASSEEISAEKAALETFTPQEADFEDLTEECQAAISEAVSALSDLHARVMAREAAEALIEAERQRLEEAKLDAQAELERMRAAVEAERAALAAERAELEGLRAAAQTGSVIEPTGPVEYVPPAAVVSEVSNPVAYQAATSVLLLSAVDDEHVTEDAPNMPPKEDITTIDPPIDVPPSSEESRTCDVALGTARQFEAMAAKVNLFGYTAISISLEAAAIALRNGDLSEIIAKADINALVEADNLLLQATLDAMLDKQEAA